MVRMDTANLNMQKEKRQDRHIQLADATAVRLLQVTYFAPDSLGRQYPQQVMTWQADKLYQAADTSRKVETTRTDYVEQKAEQQVERLAKKGNVRSPTWGLYGLAVLLLVCFLYRRIRKRE